MNKESLNKALNCQVPPKVVNCIGFVILFILGCFLFVCNAEAIAVVEDTLEDYILWTSTSYFRLAYVSLAIFWGILLFITGNMFLSYVVLELVTLVFGIVNRIVYFSRNQFVTASDLKILGEATQVEVEMGTIFHPIMIVLIIIGFINGFLLWLLTRKSKRDNKADKKRKFVFVKKVVVVIVLVICFYVLHMKPQDMVMRDVLAYKTTGNVVWFCQSLFDNVIMEITYEDSKDIYRDFAKEYSGQDFVSEKRPNIVVVMSEAFWDINNLAGVVEASENPMDEYNELVKDSVTGNVAVNIYGGGTNRSEFEFLTGMNARYLVESNCYGEYFVHKQESLVTYLKELGYYSMAFHPYDKEFWERDLGYTNMGFEAFYSDKEFINRDIYHGYISDKSVTQEIIQRFEERKNIRPEQPIFAFAVSIQNHVSDLNNIEDLEPKSEADDVSVTTSIISGKKVDSETQENVEEYYNGMRESIEALEELIQYFEDYEEDTVVVFFGDHAPQFLGLICDTRDKESEMNLYRTPYMIWTNYENDYESYGDISLAYLSSVLVEYLQLPKPNQYYLNKYMLEHYTINTMYEQEFSEELEEKKVLNMMNTMLYFCKQFPEKEMALPYWEIAE